MVELKSIKLFIVKAGLVGVFLLAGGSALGQAATGLQQLHYGNPGLDVDLAVGLWAWPMPMDYDGDGDLDLLVSCPDLPSNGTYFFENPGGGVMPVFKPGVRLGKGHRSISVSRVGGRDRILIPGREFGGFRKKGFVESVSMFPRENIHSNNVRNNQWSLLDYDGDGLIDLVVGVGDWTEYGWDNAYNARGEWLNGPLHGYVYWLRNTGSNARPVYATKQFVEAGGMAVDVYGLPTPSFADFDGDGDLDLICGEFLDGLTYFENAGSRTQPRYLAGQQLRQVNGGELIMDLQMIVPAAIDWDGDGDVDLIVGQEDGRVAFVEHTGRLAGGAPVFVAPRFFRQQAAGVKFGALSTPVAVDWDGDGDDDIVSGNTAGYIGFFENLSGGAKPRWAAGQRLKADGRVIRIQAGENGSIQGPCEAKWGYTTLSVADWDHDGLPDLLVNSIWGEVLWYRNTGSRTKPRLAAARPVEIAWPSTAPKPKWFWWNPRGDQLVTQWRTTPVAVDFTGDGLNDLVMLDHEGYLALFKRQRTDGKLELLPPRRIFVDEDNRPIQLNPGTAGSSGRRKIAVADWDGDGRLDVLVDSVNADWWRNCETRDGNIVLKRVGPLGQRQLASHSTSPCVADWDGDGKPDLLLGAEDGFFYHLPHGQARAYPAKAKAARAVRKPKQAGLIAQPGVVREEFIFKNALFKSCHASTIAQTRRGLVAAWFGGSRESNVDVSIWLSWHNGKGWSGPKEVANGIQHAAKRYACWNPVLFQPSTGPLMLFYKTGPDEPVWWGEMMTSHDGGRTWGQSRRLPEDILGPIKNKPIQLPNGDILAGSSTEQDLGDREIWKVHLELSSDMGRTWTRIGPINDGTKFNAIQPSILTHSDGRLQLLCRSLENRITTAWSSDMGRTWGPMTATTLPNPDAGTDAVTLTDGRQLFVYNHTAEEEPYDRQLLNVSLSSDGVRWQAALILENQLGEYSYPSVIQSDDGLVHITYTWRRERIKHVVIDPAKLVLRDLPNGNWPGLASPK